MLLTVITADRLICIVFFTHRPFSSTAFEPKDLLFDLLIGLVTWLRHIIFTNVGSELFQS